jgi:ribose-phosphate pyrophosphokinase
LLANTFRRQNTENIVAVSPDAGGVARADAFRTRIGAPLAIISKRHPSPDATEVLEMVGDVGGKTAIIVDDMISTGGTLTAAAKILIERGANEVIVAATHGIFAGDALDKLANSAISKVFVTNTLPLPPGPRELIEVVTVGPLLAEAIMRIHKDLSISALFT